MEFDEEVFRKKLKKFIEKQYKEFLNKQRDGIEVL